MANLSGRPLTGTRRDSALFIKRPEPMKLAVQTLLHNGNVLLVGRKGSGKTSLLRALTRELERRDRRAVFIDGRAANSLNDFLELLRDELAAWPTISVPQAAKGVVEGLTHFSRDPQISLRPTRSETQTLLGELAELRKILPDDGSIAIVDEMPSPDAAHTLFGRLRDELWELPLTWCVAADERDRGTYTEPPADAFWSRVIRMPPLTPAESAELLRRRLDEPLPERTLNQIIDAAGGIPRRLISMASEVIVENRTPTQVVRRQRQLERRAETLSEPAQRLLSELEANGPASPSDQSLLKSLGWSRSRLSQLFGELEEKDLVRATTARSTGNRPRRVYEAKI